MFPDELDQFAAQHHIVLPQTNPKRKITNYSKRMSQLDPYFNILSRDDLSHGLITLIANRTGIPRSTLSTWRSHLLVQPNWRPCMKRKNYHLRLLSDHTEEVIYSKIVERSRQKKWCPPSTLKSMAQYEYRLEVDQIDPNSELFRSYYIKHPDSLPPNPDHLICQFSKSWARNFKKRRHLSDRVPSFKRRCSPNDEQVAQFHARLEEFQHSYGTQNIYNADETSWRLLNGTIRTMAPTGSKEVNIDLHCDHRECISVLCTCRADGAKLPPVIICKGKTKRCENKYRDAIRSLRL
ncbi:hypothetical protein TRFO_26836 [Tritrichomonas foetus]|uniref:HTH CENPB-type domain-containing protein n=1 Tax=Tritrichomonas foetus TaxID=1144522 RepID=A0A1J4K7T1_9EUKA|nr:hypothetical protein TRFO_26836 [Tritrichomonas foetus]|eukprot:OHT05477.1 hypothetical protein TRFO_26836 [Tritrichomonas foetus]